jgi:hypothetical protein
VKEGCRCLFGILGKRFVLASYSFFSSPGADFCANVVAAFNLVEQSSGNQRLPKIKMGSADVRLPY